MKQSAALAVLCLCGASVHAVAGSVPEEVKRTPAVRALIAQHAGSVRADEVRVFHTTGFPEVLRFTFYISDLGERLLGVAVNGTWVDAGYEIDPIPPQATRLVLQARAWSTLDQDRRRALALRWIEDWFPPGDGSQTAADGGHPSESSIEGEEVVVSVWRIRRSTSVAGPRVRRDAVATRYRFKVDGSMSVSGGTP
jgi:hypothetical protein